MKKIDIHNHLLYGVDDGSKSKEETSALLNIAVADGIEKMIITPHYREGYFENTKAVIESKQHLVEEIIEKEKLPIEVYFGSEIFANMYSLEKVNSGELKTLNDTRYVLLETHRASLNSTNGFCDYLYNFTIDGYKPIVAHSERYEMAYKDIDIVKKWINDGCYIQINASSVVKSKRPSHKVATLLLKHNLVHFVATDAHDVENRPTILSDAYAVIEKKYGQAYAHRLFYENPLRVINDEDIPANDPKEKRKRRFLIY